MNMEYVSDFVSTLEAKHTQRAYQTDLNKFFSHIAENASGVDPESVDSDDIQKFLHAMREKGLSYSTRRRRLSAIRRFYDWLDKQNVVSRNPARGADIRLRDDEDEKKTGRFLEKEELEKLIATAGESPIRGRRDQALVLVILYAALRRGEAAALNVEHVRPLGRHWVVDVPSPSGTRGGFVKIPDLAATAVQRLVDTYEDPNGPLWRSSSNRNHGERMSPDAIYKCIRAIGENAALGAVDVETLRRSGLRLASQSGARPAQIQSHARLQDSASAVKYFDMEPEEARLNSSAADFVDLAVEL